MKTLPFDGNVVTPSGTPLGGWVHVEASDNGDYYVHFHMHSSSIFGSFDFNLRAYLSASGFPTMDRAPIAPRWSKPVPPRARRDAAVGSDPRAARRQPSIYLGVSGPEHNNPL
jgi:hypothetical protein